MNIGIRTKIGISWRVLASILLLIAIGSAYLFPKHVDKHAEAEVAKLMMNIYKVSLAYHNAIPNPAVLSEPTERKRFKSNNFGEPPQAFNSLSNAYRLSSDISMSSIVVNHQRYVDSSIDKAFGALLIRAESEWGNTILTAYDALTDYEHTYVAPNVIMIVFDNDRKIDPQATVVN